MNILYKFAIGLLFSTTVCVVQAESHGQQHHGHHNEQTKPTAKLDARIDQWVADVCGDNAQCIKEKRAYYQQRMAKYQQKVQQRCGDDQACRQKMREQYMERRAKREKRIQEHCGDDKDCRVKLREEYREQMDETRARCQDDKTCWKEFYKEKRPAKSSK